MLSKGTKVLIVNRRTFNMHSGGKMDKYLSKIMTIRLSENDGCEDLYAMYEDKYDINSARMTGGWYWKNCDIRMVIDI